MWLVPPAEEAELVRRTLMRLPPSLGPVPYTLPTFEPHITIASFPSCIPLQRLRDGISQHKSVHASDTGLDVAFAALSVGGAFFRSVLIDIVPTPALRSIREQIAEKAGPDHEARSPRYPHLSLFYVPDEHAEDRGRIREALWEDCGGVLLAEGGSVGFDLLESESGGRRRRLEGFRAMEVWIVRCQGPVEGWTVLEKIDLSKQ